MFVVDANLFIYALNSEDSRHAKARAAVNGWREGTESWFATWPILNEVMRVTTHANVFRRPLTLEKAWGFVEQLLASPAFEVLTPSRRHPDVVRSLVEEYPDLAGNIMHDFHTVAVMREHGITEIQSADTDFHRFSHLRVMNPLTTRP